MSPHAAKARGIFDRASAPIGGHEGMPDDAPEGLLREDGLMGNAHPDVKSSGLISELSMFDPSGSAASAGGGDGEGPGDEDLGPMSWPPVSLVRTTSNSSAGSAEAEESEVRTKLNRAIRQ